MKYEEDPIYNTEEKRIMALQTLLASPLWTELIEPTVLLEMQNQLEAFLDPNIDPKLMPGKAGAARALRWFLNWPKMELKTYNLTKEREKEYDLDKARQEFFAEHGFRSPYPAPDNDSQPIVNGESK